MGEYLAGTGSSVMKFYIFVIFGFWMIFPAKLDVRNFGKILRFFLKKYPC